MIGEKRESRIVFGPLSGLAAEIDRESALIVTDPEIRRLHGAAFPPCPIVEVGRGEGAKTLATVETLYTAFLDAGIDRGATVLAIGGGSVTDLAGFAASTWLRGIDFGFAPTTLLSMLDASIGGKNGVNFGGFKNLVGTISAPRFIRLDLSLLSTLPDADFASGMAEAAKHGILEGEEHFSFLERECAGREDIHPARLQSLVERSISFKTGVTRRDAGERGERRRLNLGHTIGHAVEAVAGISHGQAVACGIAAAFRLSVSRFGGDADAESRVLSFLSGWGLPTSIGSALGKSANPLRDDGVFRARVAAAIGADKKRRGSELLFVLPIRVGEVRILPLPVDALRVFVMEAP